MSLQDLVKKKYGEDLLSSVKDVEELILDSIGKLEQLSIQDKEYLEKFNRTRTISMQNIGLKSLINWPKMYSVSYVRFFPQYTALAKLERKSAINRI